jgi:hypothetical protein
MDLVEFVEQIEKQISLKVMLVYQGKFYGLEMKALGYFLMLLKGRYDKDNLF